MYNWLNKQEYPFASYYFDINGFKMHYIDEGQGEILLFVHGTPSWSFDFRNVIKILSKEYRCIAVDHMGFGLSDKPEHYDYTTINHSETLEQFILKKQLTDINLVVHDFGGPIGLHSAIKNSGKFKRLIILNSWLWSSSKDPDFIKLSKILKSPLLPFLYRVLNFSPRFIMPGSFGDNKLSKKIRAQFIKPFAKRSQRNGALAFAKSLIQDQRWFESLWKQKEAISEKPALFIWGMKDPVIKEYYLDKFLTGFINSKVVKLETSGHYPQEEQPGAVVGAIQDFLRAENPKTTETIPEDIRIKFI